VVDLVSARHHALTGMPVEVRVEDLPDSLDEPRKVCLYRIVQEGLTNALHHGNGDPASVTLRVADGEIGMRIRNHIGPSQPTEQRETRNRLGLLGMQRRLHPFGGRVEFRRNGDDAVLDARLPL
jgi:signal transduction histidine kinase